MDSSDSSSISAKADAAPLVIPIYCLVLLPLGLYLYHDILDSRWRRAQNLNLFMLGYGFLYIVSSGTVVFYTFVQALAPDFKEVGATLVALLLATYGFWKLLRLWRILTTFARLVDGPIRQCDTVLRELIPDDKKVRNFKIDFWKMPFEHRIGPELNSEQSELRFEYLSDILLDDDFPSQDAPRVKWLRKHVEVSPEDVEDAAMRFALFIRFALRSPRKQLWTLMCATNPLITLAPGRISLGRALRRLMIGGCALHTFPQKRMGMVSNPVEVMINKINGVESSKADLMDIGMAFFWLATELSHDEVAFAMGKFPPRWTRGARSTGFTYIFETATLFILADKLKETKRQSRCFSIPHDDDVSKERKQCMAATPSTEEVFEEEGKSRGPGKSSNWEVFFREEASRKSLTETLSDCLVAFLMNNARLRRKSRSIRDIVERGEWAIAQTVRFLSRPGVLVDRDGSSISVDGDLQDGCVVGVALEELVRTAEGAGFLTEAILGADLKRLIVSKHGGQAGMGKSEVVWGLAAMVQQLGWTSSPRVREMLAEWKRDWVLGDLKDEDTVFSVIRDLEFRGSNVLRHSHLSPTTWLLNALEEPCPDPIGAFAAHADLAGLLSEAVLVTLEAWCEIPISEVQHTSLRPPGSDEMVHVHSAPEVTLANTHSPPPVPFATSSTPGHSQVETGRPSHPSHSQPTLVWPARFGHPTVFHRKWMQWKLEAQGRESQGRSSYVGLVTQSPSSSMAWVRNLI